MAELGPLRATGPIVSTPAISEDWLRDRAWTWTPPDTSDWSALMTVEATSDIGTVGEVRFRVSQTGVATTPLTVSGPSGNVLMPWLNLGVGERLIILEVRRVSGSGSVRILFADGIAALTSLADVTPAPAAGNGVADLGALVATAMLSFSGGVTLVNTAPPTITGTAQVGQVLTANPGEWSTTVVQFEYQWQTESLVVPTTVVEPGSGSPIILPLEELVAGTTYSVTVEADFSDATSATSTAVTFTYTP